MKYTHANAGSGTPNVETDLSVLLGGLLVIVFGLAAVLTAIGMGWTGAGVLGMTLLIVARKVSVSESARVLPLIIAGLGVAALVGAVFDLLT
ncbi:hypothetical protein ACVW00_004165 [Marmoricola sp. URHA0025 HA25]